MALISVIYRPLLVFGVLLTASLVIFAPLAIATCILLFDMRARYVDYMRFRTRRFTPKLARELGHSWCGRGVAQTIWPEAKAFYYGLGYRAWHIFPDNAPWCFFDPKFIRSVLGIKKRSTERTPAIRDAGASHIRFAGDTALGRIKASQHQQAAKASDEGYRHDHRGRGHIGAGHAHQAETVALQELQHVDMTGAQK